MIFSQVCINFSPALQGAGRVGGGEGRVEVGREEKKPPGEDTGPPVALRWS